MNDRFDLPLSTNPDAAAAYVTAVDNLLCAGADLVGGFTNALQLDPDFALAEIGRARCLAIYGDGTRARESASRARALAERATSRERQHVNALALAVEGRGAEALHAIKEHLQDFPRDALVLQPAMSAFGLIGFSGRLDRSRELLALVDGLAPHYGDDWWFNAVRAYAEVDGGRVPDAERHVNDSLEREPRNANAAHVRAHVFYELQEHVSGAAFLRKWLQDNPGSVLLRGHLSWHLALLELALGNPDAAWALYADEIALPLRNTLAPPTPPLNVLTDSASFLWRAELCGEPQHAADWQLLSDFSTRRFPDAGVPYGDFHVAMAHARADEQGALKKLDLQLSKLALERPACGVAAAVGAGLAAYAQEDWSRAADLLSAGRANTVRLGGSRAQLDLIDMTLMRAYRHLGLEDRARALIAGRPHLQSAA